MPEFSWKWFFTWQGRVTRLEYFLSGTILALFKYVIDRSVALHFGENWPVWTYVYPSDASIFKLGHSQPQLYMLLWAIAIPFFWVADWRSPSSLAGCGQARRLGLPVFHPRRQPCAFRLAFARASRHAIVADDAAAEDAGDPNKPYWSVLGVVVATALGIGLCC